jgi:hypothetical protein
MRRLREKQRKNQTDHDDSNAEAQPRPIPLTEAERKRRLRPLKRQNQSNDAEAQNLSVALSNTERSRRHRESKRKNRPDDAEAERERNRKSMRKSREIESEDARNERLQKRREQRRQKQASILQDLPISSQTPQHAACATNARQQQSQVVTAPKENYMYGDDGNNSDSSEDWKRCLNKIYHLNDAVLLLTLNKWQGNIMPEFIVALPARYLRAAVTIPVAS